jgi:hypothetical protein
MLIVVGSAANHLRVEGDPTSLADPCELRQLLWLFVTFRADAPRPG